MKRHWTLGYVSESVTVGVIQWNRFIFCVHDSLIVFPFRKPAPFNGHYKYDLHCKENPLYVLLFWELCGLSPNFHIHVSVSNLYNFPELVHIFGCSKIDRPILEIYKSLTDI